MYISQDQLFMIIFNLIVNFLTYPYFVCQRFVQRLELSKDRSVIGIKLLHRIIDLQVEKISHLMKNRHFEEPTFTFLEKTAKDQFLGSMENGRKKLKLISNFQN